MLHLEKQNMFIYLGERAREYKFRNCEKDCRLLFYIWLNSAHVFDKVFCASINAFLNHP